MFRKIGFGSRTRRETRETTVACDKNLMDMPGSLRLPSEVGSVQSPVLEQTTERFMVEERKKLVYESMKKKLESEAVIRESAIKASQAAEKEAIAIARERGIADRHQVLDALALTLEANAKRLADEEATVAAQRDEAEVKARTLAVKEQSIEATDAEQRATAAWLRREAAKIQVEEAAMKKELDARELATRKSVEDLKVKEHDVTGLQERLKLREGKVVEQTKSLEERCEALRKKERDLARKTEALDLETKKLAVAHDTVAARTADVDARAHAVAAADAAAADRVDALNRRAEVLEVAKNEIDEQARLAQELSEQADSRLRKAEEAEKVLAAKEKKLTERTSKVDGVEAQAAKDAKDAAVVLAVAQKEAADLTAQAQRELELLQRQQEATKDDLEAQRTKLAKKEKFLDEKQAELDASFGTWRDKELALNEREAALKERELAFEMKLDEDEKKSKKFSEDETVLSTKEAALKQREADIEARETHVDDLKADLKTTLAQLEDREASVRSREISASDRENRGSKEDDARRQELVAAQPWLRIRTEPVDWECPDWVRRVTARAAKAQTDAHATLQSARSVLTKHKGMALTLLPREVRAALKEGVEVGDVIREACCDLQGAVVRRFLRLCGGDLLESGATCAADTVLKDTLRSLRGIAAQEVARRSALLATTFEASYYGETTLGRIPQRPAAATTTLFRLKHNRFEALRLRPPAAKSRFAAATAHWAAPEFRRTLFDIVASFNGIPQTDRHTVAAREGSRAMTGVFFCTAGKCELRFDDDGDDGRHAPRATCVFENPTDLVAFIADLESAPGVRCLGIANGFDDSSDDDAPLEVAIALDLADQGVLADVRLRLRPLELIQRHLGSLSFLADVDSHEEILQPLWRDLNSVDGFLTDIHQFSAAPPPYDDAATTRLPTSDRPTSGRSRPSSATKSSSSSSRLKAPKPTEWPAPPNWTSHAGVTRRYS